MNEKLIEDHICYVQRVAMDVCRNVPCFVSAEELFGAGYLALCEAAASFDPSAGASFTTWAYRPIRSAVTVEAWWIVNWRGWHSIGRARSPKLTDWEDWRDLVADPRAGRTAFWHDLALDYIRSRLSELQEPDRTVLQMGFFEGRLRGQIAVLLGKSETSISVYKKRGLSALWTMLCDEEDELTALLETQPRRVVRDLAKYHASKAYSRPGAKTAYIALNRARLEKRGKD